MCRYFSAIVTKDLKAHWSKKTTAHEQILDQIRLDSKVISTNIRDFVAIEITPKDPEKISRKTEDWQLKVDIDNIKDLPEWFVENRQKAEKNCWKAWEESVQIQIGINDEHKGILYDTLVFLYDSSSAVLNDSSRAVLNDSSSAVLNGSSRAELNGSSSAVLNGSSRAELNDSSRAELNGSSSAVLKSTLGVGILGEKIFVHPMATLIQKDVVNAAEQ